MKTTRWLCLAALLALGRGPHTLTGRPTAASGEEAKIQANPAKLPPADRKLAEAQKWCAVEDEHLLGSMGAPVKVLVKGQPVFLCCKSCQDEALADPDKTLDKVKELKAKAAKTPEK